MSAIQSSSSADAKNVRLTKGGMRLIIARAALRFASAVDGVGAPDGPSVLSGKRLALRLRSRIGSSEGGRTYVWILW